MDRGRKKSKNTTTMLWTYIQQRVTSTDRLNCWKLTWSELVMMKTRCRHRHCTQICDKICINNTS